MWDKFRNIFELIWIDFGVFWGKEAQPSWFPPIENIFVGVVVYDVMNLLIKFHEF